jgi:hypothetical protein
MIEKFERDARVEIPDDHAIWELMYFGKARSPTPRGRFHSNNATGSLEASRLRVLDTINNGDEEEVRKLNSYLIDPSAPRTMLFVDRIATFA